MTKMTEDFIGNLSEELEPFRAKFMAAVRPYIKILAKPAQTKLWQSKFRGYPYLPKDQEYPHGESGRPLVLLAQINFAEAPALPAYPKDGLLQFFIAADDDLYGMDLDDSKASMRQKNFRVRYFPSVDYDESRLVTDFGFVPDDDSLPARRECALAFELRRETVPMGDYNFEKIFGNDFFEQFGAKQSEVEDELWDKFNSDGHKLGGYAYFTQEDPRYSVLQDENWLLLLQMDTDDDADIMWGDVGVGAFFIRDEDLRKRDFSRVLYNWDCS